MKIIGETIISFLVTTMVQVLLTVIFVFSAILFGFLVLNFLSVIQ